MAKKKFLDPLEQMIADWEAARAAEKAAGRKSSPTRNGGRNANSSAPSNRPVSDVDITPRFDTDALNRGVGLTPGPARESVSELARARGQRNIREDVGFLTGLRDSKTPTDRLFRGTVSRGSKTDQKEWAERRFAGDLNAMSASEITARNAQSAIGTSVYSRDKKGNLKFVGREDRGETSVPIYVRGDDGKMRYNPANLDESGSFSMEKWKKNNEDFGRQQATGMRNASNVGKVVINGRAFNSVSEARKFARQTARENVVRREAVETIRGLGIDLEKASADDFSGLSSFKGFDATAGGALTRDQKNELKDLLQGRVNQYKKKITSAKGGNYDTYRREQEQMSEGTGPHGSGNGERSSGGGGRPPRYMTATEVDARRREEASAKRSMNYQDRMEAERQRLKYANSGRGSYDRSVANMKDALYQAQADENRKVTRGLRNLLRSSRRLGIDLDLD